MQIYRWSLYDKQLTICPLVKAHLYSPASDIGCEKAKKHTVSTSTYFGASKEIVPTQLFGRKLTAPEIIKIKFRHRNEKLFCLVYKTAKLSDNKITKLGNTKTAKKLSLYVKLRSLWGIWISSWLDILLLPNSFA